MLFSKFTSYTLFLLTLSFSASHANPTRRLTARQSAPTIPAEFAIIDISRIAGDGQVAQQAADDVCDPGLGSREMERLRQIAEKAEKQFFNPALASAPNRNIKRAIQCQKDRNKILKNTCFLRKGQLNKNQFIIDKKTKQLVQNAENVTRGCAAVDPSLFISSGGVGGGGGDGAAGNAGSNSNANSNTGASNIINNGSSQSSNNNNNNNNVIPISFAAVDISRRAGDPLANAISICPNTDSPSLLESKSRAAEDAEKRIFNAGLRAAKNDRDKRVAILCQKHRNKVLKNQCQLVKAQLENDQAKIDENTRQVTKNMVDATSACQGVNTALFISN
jgi:hypothetical protein